MRIIGGKFKGRKFYPPKNLPVRPTTDFAKEALFNVLNNRVDLEDMSILDLFAGTGSMSLEFFSRGASKILSMDQSPACIKYMYQLKKDMELKDWSIQRAEVSKGIQRLKTTFDVIFADPPYEMKGLEQMLDSIAKSKLLKEDGLLIFEHSKKFSFEEHPQFIDSKNYGNVNFTFFAPLSHE